MYSLKNVTKLLFSVTTSALFLTACNGDDTSKKTDAAKTPQGYPTFTITAQSTIINTDYPATLQGIENIDIRPKVDGFIQKIHIDEGSVVRKNQLLFTIDAPQYEQALRTATAAISSAEADVNAAQLQVNKTRPLVEKGIISKFDLESTSLTLQSKQALLSQAKANLANAKINLGYTKILSPVDGVIGSIPYRTGSLVSSNSAQPLTTVSNTSKVYAYFSLNEKQLLDFSNLYKGNTLSDQIKNIPAVSLILADGSNYHDKGKIESINGLINTSTGSASMRATFPNPTKILKSGGSALVRIPKNLEHVILIPQKATMDVQGKKFAYVLGDSSKVINTEIQIMNVTKGKFYIVTEGLKVGDKVVLEGFQTLSDKLQIKPEEKSADSVYADLKN